MPLNKQKPGNNMYQFCNFTYTPIRGRCPYRCSYCYAQHFSQKPLHLDQKDLKLDLYKDSTPDKRNFIFVCSTIDMFHPDVEFDWIWEVMTHCNKYPENTYLFQSKNPFRFFNFVSMNKLPPNAILGTTIESNKQYDISKAPPCYYRKCDIVDLRKLGCRVMVTIEPIMQFDLDVMVQWMKDINPLWINIGADSKGHNLDEPSWEKVEQLINELEKFTKVVLKNNLGRLKK